ncbi:MAG: (p)ppGpp synthetase [Clostridia bacterium]
MSNWTLQEETRSYYPVAVQKDPKNFSTINQMICVYNAAMKELVARLNILNDECKLESRRALFHHIESRLKTPDSILEKAHRKGLQPTAENLLQNILDIAGVRVVCSYIQDVYDVFKFISIQDDLEIYRVRDYIENPKPNGYRSLHMVIRVPVHRRGGVEHIPVEMQIRTMAMDFWASLEHDLRYKKIQTVGDIDISEELLACNIEIAAVEKRMQAMADMLGETDSLSNAQPLIL